MPRPRVNYRESNSAYYYSFFSSNSGFKNFPV